jgi:hypothetical protein
MNTQSHAILNLFLLRKTLEKKPIPVNHLNSIIVSGSILPDIPIFFFTFWYRWMVPTPHRIIWKTLYFREDWQMLFNLFHSFPIFLILIGLAYYFSKPRLWIFFMASLLHFSEDFFVHQEDGHAHFFPLSSYKFISPISYWDPGSFGQYFYIFESLLLLVVSFPVFRYIKTGWGKVLLVLANASLWGGPVFWHFVFSHPLP